MAYFRGSLASSGNQWPISGKHIYIFYTFVCVLAKKEHMVVSIYMCGGRTDLGGSHGGRRGPGRLSMSPAVSAVSETRLKFAGAW